MTGLLIRAAIEAAERGLPDGLVRWGMRRAIAGRLRVEQARPEEEREEWLRRWWEGPIALAPDQANRQHYEVPPGFFQLILGPHLKYSACLWPDQVDDLADAEEAMLQLTSVRAGIADGMRVLDLGCGWGSLALWVGERFPGCEVLAVSNSRTQGEVIARRAAERGMNNVRHEVGDVNHYQPAGHFDRVVSVEMFEHVRNHPRLIRRIGEWLTPEGRLFVHVFAHHRYLYPFDDQGPGDWMARTFFSGGVMPSHDLFTRLPPPGREERRWWLEGTHYQRTLDAWLANLDRNRDEVAGVLAPVYHPDPADRWVQRWRMFLMACSELFGFDGGREWGVSHHLFRFDHS